MTGSAGIKHKQEGATMIKKKVSPKKSTEVKSTMSDTSDKMDVVSGRIKAGGDYGKWGMEFFMSRNIPVGSDPSEAFDDMTSILNKRMDEYIEDNGFTRATQLEVVPDYKSDIEDGNTEETEETLTEEDIAKMKRPALVELIASEELDIDADEYKKINDLRNAVLEVAFGEEEAEEEEEVDDVEEDSEESEGEEESGEEDDWDGFGEGEEEEDEEESEEEEGLTEDDIMELERPALIKLIKEEDIDVDPKKFKVLSKLRKAVIDAAFE